LEPEVEEWLSSLPIVAFGAVAFHIDRLAEQGPALRMPHSRALGNGLFELRFYLDRVAERITYFFPGGRRIVALTEFRKQKMNERAEIDRARAALARCVREGHTVEEDLR
jgi:phage-related protein